MKVLDFGLAKTAPLGVSRDVDGRRETAQHASAISEATLTSPGLQVGTFAYMSPEQARGEPLDARTDLFSCRRRALRDCDGQRAFSGESVALVCDQVLNRQPAAPRPLNPEIPGALEADHRAGAGQASRGTLSVAEEMAADLRSLDRPPATWRRFRSEPSRMLRGGVLALAAAAAVALVLAAVAAMAAVMRVKAVGAVDGS